MFYQGGNLVCVPLCLLYISLPLIFTLVATSISHFLTAAINFSRFSSNKIHLLCFFFISHSTRRLTWRGGNTYGCKYGWSSQNQNFLHAEIIKFCYPWYYAININIISITFIYWKHRPPQQCVSHPFGPTKPYRRPAVMLRFALTNRSLPRAEMLNFSTYKTVINNDELHF